MKVKFWVDEFASELAMEVNGHRWYTSFDVCELLCRAEAEIEIPEDKIEYLKKNFVLGDKARNRMLAEED